MAIKPCRADAFEVVPKEDVLLDLAECERLLAGSGYEIVSNPGVMLVIRKQVEMTLYKHGRILMHPVTSREAARSLAYELYAALGL